MAPAASAAVNPGTYTVTNVSSGKCVDAASAATANATVVQQYSCNGSGAQQWTFTATDSGYFRIGAASAPAQVWDVTNVSTADQALVQLWLYGGGANQQWLPVDEGNGNYHLVNRNSGKCLDVPGASVNDSVQLQQYTCNGTAAQSFSIGGGGTTPPPPPGTPDFGPNVTVFDPSMSASTIQSKLTSVFSAQETAQFGTGRYALLFKPGTYNVDANVGYYEQVAGLGLTPGQVTINGQVHVEADWDGGNATQNFWRDAEGLTINPPGGTNTWAVSQADPLRRVQVNGNLKLDDNGWSSGGFLADSRVTGQVQSGSQQQWLSRNDTIGSWAGSNWNMVFSGVQGAPGNTFPSPPYTTITNTAVIAEKPYLYVDGSGNYNVFVPALRTNSSGTSWANGNPAGTSLPISQFYIVKSGDTAATINAQLAAGKNLLVTPGIYHLNQTLNVTRADTVILGLGVATFVPDNGVTAISTADVNGVKIAGLLIDAGTTNSQTLVQVGPSGSSADHSADPTVLSDVHFRIGGATVGKATQSLVVNSNNVITDDTWLWRADHGNGGTVGWGTNTAQNGLIVNGNNVTAYGLFAEHYQQYQVIWNGQGGKTVFYQSEMPYDVPNQASYMNGTRNGWASYKVGANVTSHEAWGLGVYCYFSANTSVNNYHAFEAPQNSNVKFHDIMDISLGNSGSITHVINDTGAQTPTNTTPVNIVSYP
ncbi:RICIN domain-containing protein [Kutzneria sp. NPDC052558]|uniref:RICIN domain-containing protein n=1 Tax=Kutzneria sp. NPDC052558 TaxID=3364121 RepID=UPI0037C9B098